MQHSGHMGNFFQTGKTIEIQQVRPTEVCGKYILRKMAKGLLKHHLCCPMFFGADHQNSCLFTNLYGVSLVF